jgi:acyl dehydratase
MLSELKKARFTRVGGPFFDDLTLGQRFDSAPALTITSGLAAAHQAILGDRLRLALDACLSARVLRGPVHMAHPGLVSDIAIGQSTVATGRVIANLFYRGLLYSRAPVLGDTLVTSTEVVALRHTSAKPGRPRAGLAVLRVHTTDQRGRRVLDFLRCAMLPLRDQSAATEHADDIVATHGDLDVQALRTAAEAFDLDWFRDHVPGSHAIGLVAGDRWEIEAGDVVSAAPELARLTLNLAMAHHDSAASVNRGGQRLVYGGHTIGVASAQANRALPNLVTILAWHGCDHIGPVYEGETLHSELELERIEHLPGGALAHLSSRVLAARPDGRVPVLHWRFIGLMA